MKTSFPTEISPILGDLFAALCGVLGADLTGLYLYGSAVWGDYTPGISDLDLVAALADDFSAGRFADLKALHAEFSNRHPAWNSHIEVVYISRCALQTFKSKRSPIAVISPGEPLNIKDAGPDWMMNWYLIQEKGATLYGLDSCSIIAPISKTEFVEAVRRHAGDWRAYIAQTQESRAYQGYAILTMCRALYTCQFGEQPSKLQAARWAMGAYPKWAGQIEKALNWRTHLNEVGVDPAAMYPETEAFVLRVADLITVNMV